MRPAEGGGPKRAEILARSAVLHHLCARAATTKFLVVLNVKTPLIVLHGVNDTNVPVGEAEQVVDSLDRFADGLTSTFCYGLARTG